MNEIYDKFNDSITEDLLEFNHKATPEPDTLFIRMTRGKHRIVDELFKRFGDFKRVVINVDGERHEFGADSLIQMLEGYEDESRWCELFGTPERTAQTLAELELDHLNWCHGTDGCGQCPYKFDRYGCYLPDDFSLLEWLRGDV